MVTGRKTSTGEATVLLTGKLRPPLLHRVLVRQRLLKLAGEADQTRITIISGGPGYGKTTLMTHMIKSHAGPALWYQVDSHDNDPALFLRNIIEGVSQAVADVAPGLGERAIARLEAAGNISEEGDSILGVLSDELSEKVKAPLLMCFDDYHLLTDRGHANRLMGFLARQGPERLRLALTSRTKPRLPLGRLRSQGKVVEIGETDLRFSLAEMQELMASTWEVELSPESVRQLYENTEGWAASFVLAENLLKRGETVTGLFAGAAIRKNIYEYLAEEVLSRQPEGLRDFLLKSSLVDPVDPEVCRRALALDGLDIQGLLDTAEENNLFTSRIEDTGLFRYHPLFREFLQEHLGEAGETKVRDLHIRFAEVFEAAGKMESAIDHYFAGGVISKATELLVKIGGDLIASGRFTTLEKWLDQMPEGEGPAAIDVYRGEILLLKGETVEAKEVLENVRPRIGNQTDILIRCSLALAESMNMLFMERDAVQMLKSVLDLELDAEDRLEVLIKLGICLALCHQSSEAETYLRKAKKLAESELMAQSVNRVEELSGFISALRGDFLQARKKMEKAIMSNDMKYASYNSQNLVRMVCIMILNGDYAQAEEKAHEIQIRIEDQKENRLIPYIRDTIAWIETAKGNFKAGEKIMIETINELKEVDPPGAAETIRQLGTTYRRMGRFIDALEQHKRLMTIVTEANDLYGVAIADVSLGADLVHLDQIDEAIAHLDKAEIAANEYEISYVSTQIEYYRAWIEHLRGNEEEVVRFMEKALGRAQALHHNHFIIQESRITLPIIAMALANEIESDYLFWVLEQRGDAALPALEPLINHDNPVQRQKAAQAIGKIESSSSLSLLRRMTRDSDTRVRMAARSSIEQLRPRFKTPRDLLTAREEEVLRLIAEGLSNSSIGKSLFISERTVKTHISRIFQKLGMTNRLEAALYYKGLKDVTS